MSRSNLHQVQQRKQLLALACNAATGLFVVASFILVTAATFHIFLACSAVFLAVVGGTELIRKTFLGAPPFHLGWVLIVSAIALASCAYSPDPVWSFKASRNMAFFLICSNVLFQSIHGINDLERVLRFIWIAGFIMSLMLIASYVTGSRNATEHRQGIQVSDSISRTHDYESSSGVNANTAGLFCALAFTCGIYFIEVRRRKLLYAIITLPIAAGIMLTASRGAVSFSVAAATIQLSTIPHAGKRISAIFRVAMVASTVFAVAYIIPQVSQWFYTTAGHRIVGDSVAAESSVRIRKEIVESSIQLISEKPLLGHGFASFQYTAGTGYFTDSTYLELLTGVGIVGTVAYYSIYLYALFHLFKGVRQGEWHARLLFTLLVCLLLADFWIITAWYPPVLIVLALAVAYVSRVNPRSRTRLLRA